MKTILKASVYLAMAAMFVTVVLASPAAAKKQVPFHGFLQGVEIDVFRARPYWSMGLAPESAAISVDLR